MSFHAAEPQADHLSSKQHAILYKQSVTEEGCGSQRVLTSWCVEGMTEKKRMSGNKGFISIDQELLFSK